MDLLPGLQDELVLAVIVPRLPWYTRPIARVLSQRWRDSLHYPSIFSASTREVQGVTTGFVVLATSSPRYSKSCLLFDEATGSIHKLPPLPRSVSPSSPRSVQACHGKVFLFYAIGNVVHASAVYAPADIWMLDMGSGLWQWEKLEYQNKASSMCFAPSVTTYSSANKLIFFTKSSCLEMETLDAEHLKWDEAMAIPSVHDDSILRKPCMLQHCSGGDQVLALFQDPPHLAKFDVQGNSWTSLDNFSNFPSGKIVSAATELCNTILAFASTAKPAMWLDQSGDMVMGSIGSGTVDEVHRYSVSTGKWKQVQMVGLDNLKLVPSLLMTTRKGDLYSVADSLLSGTHKVLRASFDINQDKLVWHDVGICLQNLVTIQLTCL